MSRNESHTQVSANSIFCESLLVERGRIARPYAIGLHVHEFWQAEMVTNGQIELELDGKSHTMLERSLAIMPPGCGHLFRYPAGASYLSFKFSVIGGNFGSVPVVTDNSAANRALCTLLDDTVPKTGDYQRVNRGMLGHLLAALIIHNFCKPVKDADVHEGSFSDEIIAFVRRQVDRRVTVEEIARYMCFSVRTVSSRFKNEQSLGLKQWLDKERGRVAEELLMYSDMNAGQVAEHMGFSDLYSFSRFCRRVLGESPRRIQARPTGKPW